MLDLQRESKTGKITKSNLKTELTIALTIGNIALGGMLFAINRYNTEDRKLTHYTNYSDQIEVLYNVDIGEKTEEVLNKMQENLDLVNHYRSATSDVTRTALLSEMVETQPELSDSVLKLVKINVAEEHGGNSDGYIIKRELSQSGSYVDAYAKEVIWDRFGRAIEGRGFSLDKKSANLVETLVHFEDSAYINGDQTKNNADKFVNNYENLIKEAAKYVVQTSDKAK